MPLGWDRGTDVVEGPPRVLFLLVAFSFSTSGVLDRSVCVVKFWGDSDEREGVLSVCLWREVERGD